MGYAIMIIIVGFMVAIIGIRQDKFYRWFREHIDFLEGNDDEGKGHNGE